MALQEHVLTVFVASPGDVDDERGKLEEVIRELNLTWSRELAVRLDLVRWETQAYPGMGADPQDVINEQIPDDCDLFVCIMWCRYGTSTERAGSGTIEEFQRAKARYDADPSCVKIMVYFKDEQICPSLMDPMQLAKVHEFRDSLGKEGALYWKFRTIDEFEKLIRLHLTRQVQVWTKKLDESATLVKAIPGEVSAAEQETKEDDDDLGIIDLMETFEDRFEELASISKRIGKATEDLAEKMDGRTAEMARLPRDSQGNANRKDAKRLMARTASDLDQYTARVGVELPLFRDAMNTGINSLIRAATMSGDFRSDDAGADQAREGLDALVTLRGVLATSRHATMEFRAAVAELPRITTVLNRAKRGVTDALDRLLEEFASGETLLGECEEAVRELMCD